jgi:hypothetical protein
MRTEQSKADPSQLIGISAFKLEKVRSRSPRDHLEITSRSPRDAEIDTPSCDVTCAPTLPEP